MSQNANRFAKFLRDYPITQKLRKFVDTLSKEELEALFLFFDENEFAAYDFFGYLLSERED